MSTATPFSHRLIYKLLRANERFLQFSIVHPDGRRPQVLYGRRCSPYKGVVPAKVPWRSMQNRKTKMASHSSIFSRHMVQDITVTLLRMPFAVSRNSGAGALTSPPKAGATQSVLRAAPHGSRVDVHHGEAFYIRSGAVKISCTSAHSVLNTSHSRIGISRRSLKFCHPVPFEPHLNYFAQIFSIYRDPCRSFFFRSPPTALNRESCSACRLSTCNSLITFHAPLFSFIPQPFPRPRSCPPPVLSLYFTNS
jgi:hypothetical protein